MRSKRNFPIKGECNIKLCNFLNTAWVNGWLDEYSDDHFLIKAIENRLVSFVGKEQLVENNINIEGMINTDGSINTTSFNINFCINFSRRMQYLSQIFGIKNIKNFMMNQMSAGKQHYKEDTFFQALSEVSILSFYAGKYNWDKAFYEPPVVSGINNKNPEATFLGTIDCKTDKKNEHKKTVKINIEVKSPEFPHDNHMDEKIVIPTLLLTNDGRENIKKFCEKNKVKYLDPRVLKLRDFINNAAEKFVFPEAGEFNLLYINWSYRDFPSNSFLEAWSLLTNKINGILTCPEFGLDIGFLPEAYNKISAIIVYTESLEGLMFSDFRYVWQHNGVGPRFRMWVLDERLRQAEWNDESNILLHITGMNPSKALTQSAMIDYKSKTIDDRMEREKFCLELTTLFEKNVKRQL